MWIGLLRLANCVAALLLLMILQSATASAHNGEHHRSGAIEPVATAPDMSQLAPLALTCHSGKVAAVCLALAIAPAGSTVWLPCHRETARWCDRRQACQSSETAAPPTPPPMT